METTTTVYDLLNSILAGGLLGILGQGIRTIIGLKKLNEQGKANPDNKELFTTNRLLISLFIGFLSGSLAILAKWGSPLKLTNELIMGLIAAGYSGTDFIEGLFNTYIKKITSVGQAKAFLSQESIAYEVKKAILNTKGDNSTDPYELLDAINLKDNLLFNNNDYIMLALRLNELILIPAKKITIAEINKCKIVGDCVALVKSKTS